MRRRLAPAVATLVALAACGGGESSRPPPTPPPGPAAAAAAGAGAPDPLGPRPAVAEQAAYAPPVPTVYTRADGTTVWLLERHGLPMVSVQLVVPAGSSSDPEDKAGLATMTAGMLDEGAGKRGALDFARDLDRLGATFQTGAALDYGYARMTVLKKNFAAAAALFGDAIVRPRFSAAEWKRVHDLWVNGLKARQSDPNSVASVVVTRKVYVEGDPYGHPADGTLASAAKVGLADVRRHYAERWRPDRATLVVVGDVTRAELDPELDRVLAGWRSPGIGLGRRVAAPALGRPARKVYVVDRPDAPQSVIAVARRGVAALDDASPLLVRVNYALGGSFTSRLNQELREEHGWTYGAHSRFGYARSRGAFVAQAAVQTEHTGDALAAMIAGIEKMAKEGLTEEEVAKTRSLARAEVVESYETVEATAGRLGRLAGIGLPPDRDATQARAAEQADKAALDAAAATYLDLTGSVVVIVGPQAKIAPQLEAIGLGSFAAAGPEGDDVAPAPAKAKAKK